MLDAQDAASDATSKTDHGTGAGTNRTVDPYTTSTTDVDEANFGWAVNPSDMNSVTGAKRFYPAGNHTATIRMGHNGATNVTGSLTLHAYRVGPAAARTRTLLGFATAAVTLPVASGEVIATVTLALNEIIFEVDETIQYSFLATFAGIAVVGRIVTFFTGTQNSTVCRVDTPKLGVLADTTGTATGTGAGVGVGGKVLGTIGAATGLGTGAGVGAARADTTGTATGTGTAVGLGSAVAGTIGTATGLGTAAGLMSIVLGTVGTVDIGGGGGGITVTQIFAVLD